MREYSKALPRMWQGKTMKALRRYPEGVIVALYLMTSPSSNMLGLFAQPVLYMAHETGLGEEGARKGLQRCIEAGFCSYDEESEFVWVHEMASYQIASELKSADKRCIGIQKDYAALSDNPFLGAFFDRYAAAFHLTVRRGDGHLDQGASQAPSKPHRSQEQEQEQEQEQDSPSLRSGEGGAGAPPPPPAPAKPKRQKGEARTLSVYLAECRAAGVKPVPDDHHIRGWTKEAGIAPEMLQIAWVQFRDRYTNGEKGKRKRYINWPDHFATAVKGNWFKLWFQDDDGEMAWTSVGLTFKKVLDARHAAQQGDVDAPA